MSYPLCRRVIVIETRLDLSDRRQYINFQGGDMNLMRANHSTAQSSVIDTAGWLAIIGQKKYDCE